jgi:predicted phage-related endonuclease
MKITSTRRTGVSSSKIDAILNKSKFKTALEQFLLDTKQIEETFTETGKQKMEMGKVMEPIIKDLVEKTLNVKLVVDKNRYQHDIHDMFTIEFDALDVDNGVIYEFKNTEKDEKTILKTYYPQVQFAMYMSNYQHARICYLRNGWELGYIDVKRDENFIKYMEAAALYYANCLVHNKQPDLSHIDYIVSNIDFYRGEENTLKGVGVNLDLNTNEVELLYEWNDLKQHIANLEYQEGIYKNKFSEKFGKYNDGTLSFSNVEMERDGGYDLHTLMKDHPEINFNKYKRENTKYARQMLRVKKPKESIKLEVVNTEDIV